MVTRPIFCSYLFISGGRSKSDYSLELYLSGVHYIILDCAFPWVYRSFEEDVNNNIASALGEILREHHGMAISRALIHDWLFEWTFLVNFEIDND